jgi:hypothetical protein
MVPHPRAALGAYSLRALNTSQPTAVQVDAAGLPSNVRREGGPARAVDAVLDRWRIDDEWWRERPISRAYYALLLDNGARLTVYRDLIDGSWHEQTDAKRQPRP